MDATDLASAKRALRIREGIPEKNEEKHIGTWSIGQQSPRLIPGLTEWAVAHGLSHVIWTNLPPKFNNTETTPTVDQVLQYLSGLTGSKRDVAYGMFVSHRGRLIPHTVVALRRHFNGP